MNDLIFANAELVNKLVAVLKKAKKAGISETECEAVVQAVIAKTFETK
ncbi:hypothetical protein [Albidovulum sp.]